LFGVSETSARLVPALAALGVIASTLWFGSRWFHPRVGLIAGAVLMLSVGFGFSSRYLFLDGVLTLLVMLSLATAYESIRGDRFRWGWWIASGICCGLGFLTKGPLSIVLLLPPLFAFAWLTESVVKPSWRHYGALLTITGLVAAPWLFLVHHADPGFLVEFFYTHNVKRFAGHFHERPIWYYIPVLLIAGHPWTFLTIPFGQFLFRRQGEATRQRPPALGYLFLWSAWCFLFFSLSRCKLPSYLLPAAPAMSLMISHYLHLLLARPEGDRADWLPRHWSPWAAKIATYLAAIGFIGYLMVTGIDHSLPIYGWTLVWVALLAARFVPSSFPSFASYGPRMAWASTGGVMFLFAIMMMHEAIPAYSRATTLLGPNSMLSQQITSRSQPPIATIAHEFSEVPFYLNRSDIEHFEKPEDNNFGRFLEHHDRALLIVSSMVTEERLRESFPDRVAIKTIADRGYAKIIEVQPAVDVPKIATGDTMNVK
jgi:dolichol-phosphate mannosyltransferase